MSYHDDLLTAAESALNLSTGLAALTIKGRPRPVYVRDADRPPLLIVSMPANGYESVHDLTFGTTAFGEALMDFPVVVTLVFANNQDTATRAFVGSIRQAVWEALWRPLLPGYDVEYDPNSGGVAHGLTDPLDSCAQLFTYRQAVPRMSS